MEDKSSTGSPNHRRSTGISGKNRFEAPTSDGTAQCEAGIPKAAGFSPDADFQYGIP